MRDMGVHQCLNHKKHMELPPFGKKGHPSIHIVLTSHQYQIIKSPQLSMYEDSFFSNSASYIFFPEPTLQNNNKNTYSSQAILPWQCPVCKARFKWDTQLLRHERKLNHYNPQRTARQERRYKRVQVKVFNCALCSTSFQTSLERLEHMRWCEADPKTQTLRRQYTSSWDLYTHQCYAHELPFYFHTQQQLQKHIKTHRKFDQEKLEKVKKTFRWKKRQGRVGLSNKEYEEIANAAKIKMSFAALRRLFKKL